MFSNHFSFFVQSTYKKKDNRIEIYLQKCLVSKQKHMWAARCTEKNHQQNNQKIQLNTKPISYHWLLFIPPENNKKLF